MTNEVETGEPVFDEELFRKEALALFFHPICNELRTTLNVELPSDIESVFKNSCRLYNDKTIASPYSIVRTRTARNNSDYFYNLLHTGVQNAFSGLMYNLNSFCLHSSWVRQKGKELFESVSLSRPQTMSIPTQKLILEYEHFTLRSRILLNRLNWFLNYFFCTDTGNLYKLHKQLSQPNWQTNVFAEKVRLSIEKNRELLDELISTDKLKHRAERDLLAHREEIQFTTVNIMAMPDKSIRVVLLLPNIPFGDIEADELLHERFEKLSRFVVELISSFFGFV